MLTFPGLVRRPEPVEGAVVGAVDATVSVRDGGRESPSDSVVVFVLDLRIPGRAPAGAPPPAAGTLTLTSGALSGLEGRKKPVGWPPPGGMSTVGSAPLILVDSLMLELDLPGGRGGPGETVLVRTLERSSSAGCEATLAGLEPTLVGARAGCGASTTWAGAGRDATTVGC